MLNNPSLTLRWQTGNSSTGTCPALYEAASDYVVQGKVRPGGAIWVDADVLDRLGTHIGPAATSSPGSDGQPGYLVRGQQVSADVMGQLVDHGVDESAVFVDRGQLTPEV